MTVSSSSVPQGAREGVACACTLPRVKRGASSGVSLCGGAVSAVVPVKCTACIPFPVDALLGVALGGVDALREQVESRVLLLKLATSGVADTQGITGWQSRALDARRCGLLDLGTWVRAGHASVMTTTYRIGVDPHGWSNVECSRLAIVRDLAVVILHLVVVGDANAGLASTRPVHTYDWQVIQLVGAADAQLCREEQVYNKLFHMGPHSLRPTP